jgi:hypothetical protein
MKAPSGRLILAIGTVLTLVSGGLLFIDGSTRATTGGPYGFLDGVFALALLPGGVLLLACWLLYSSKPNEALAGTLGAVGAVASIPLALAGFWVGFVCAITGSFVVLRKVARVGVVASTPASSSSHSSRPFRIKSGSPWTVPVGVTIVAVVAIVLLCPQTIPADAVELADMLNEPDAYDLQAAYVGATGGGSFSYDVNAIPQTGNCALGYAYFVNGYLNNSGQVYWYQVGLSYDWGGGTFGSYGWGLAYEVFGPNGDSLYPSPYGGAGVTSFSGPVNSGDPVVLSLSIGSGTVSFTGSDSTTHSSASVSYSSEGASQFGGGMPPQSPGYFTGVMTECYRDSSLSTSLNDMTYAEQGGSQTQAAVLVEEIDFSAGRLPYLPSLQLPEMHTNFTVVGPVTTVYHAYGLTLAYSSSTFTVGTG